MGNLGGGDPVFSLNDMLQSLRNDIREARQDLRDDIGEARQELGAKTDALMNRVIEQNSRIGKGEERHIALSSRLEAVERVLERERERQHQHPDTPAPPEDQRPVTRREAHIVYWTLAAFVGGLVGLWQLGVQVFRVFKP